MINRNANFLKLSRICRSRAVHDHHTQPQVHTWGKPTETYSTSTARNNSRTILDDAVDFSNSGSSLPSASHYSNLHLRNGSSNAGHSDWNYNNCRPCHCSTSSHWSSSYRCPVCCTIDTKQHSRLKRSMRHLSSSFEYLGINCWWQDGQSRAVPMVWIWISYYFRCKNLYFVSSRLAAFYHSSSGFICGGSLISAKLVVTAAHCIQNKNEQVRRRAEDSTFYLGKHNLESLFEPNIVVAGVTDLIVHPNWNFNDDHFDADIAIAVLLNHVPFSKFIRPICIWTETSSYEDMIGHNGVVTGWGKTEFDAISTGAPRWTDLPVVSLVTCLQSNKAFNDLTSDRTFCAGKTSDMRGPCSGDSGESRGISVDVRNII